MNERQKLITYSILEGLVIGLLIILHVLLGWMDPMLLWIVIINLAIGIIALWVIPSYAFQLLLLVIALSTGTYGFKVYATVEMSVLDAFYTTLRLFSFNTDTVVAQTDGLISTFPLSIEIARWAAALYTVSAIFAVATKLFGQSMKLFWYQLFGKHYVIYGFHKQTKILAKNLRQRKKKVVIVADTITELEKRDLEELGVVVLTNDRKRYQKSRLKKAGYYLLFHEDDTKNLAELIELKDQFFKSKSMKEFLNLKIYLHLQHQHSYDIFEKFVAKLKAENKDDEDIPKFLQDYFPVRVVHTYRLLAEKLWEDYPLYKGYEERVRDQQGEALQLAIIGFGDTGNAVLLEALERAHFLNKSMLKAVIFDQDAEKLKKRWQKTHSKVRYIADVKFEEFDTESEQVSEYQEKLHSASHIIVSLPDDSINMTIGMELSKAFPAKPIIIKMANEAFMSQWIHDDVDEFGNIICFGDWNDVLNEDYFINEKMDTVAKQVHGNYIRDKGKGVPSKWERLDDFKKESNRKQAAHALTKVVLAGFTPVKEATDSDVIVKEKEFNQQIQPIRDRLAEVEHERWNAFHYIRGWDTKHHIEKGSWKDEQNKLHGCLVPFEQLPEVSRKVGIEKSFEYWDYQVVDRLYKTVVNELGYQIVRRK
ncbi:hypothetical protein CJ195_26875 [Bacillus sp. UMB0899]|nr:hypothetical protein CJ195_26875 [Bacillus sp. UMB0899]